MFRLAAILVASLVGAVAAGAHAGTPEVGSGANLLPGQLLLRAEPEAVVRKLLEKKLLVLDGEGQRVRAFVLFDQPRERVFDLLAATARQGEYRSELEALETVAQLPDGHVDEHRIRILFMEVGYRLRYRLDPARQWIRWELDPGLETPMRRIEGSWELFDLDPAHSLGHFSTLVDVGEALPAFLEEAVTRRTLPGTLERCRRWVDAGGAMP